MKQDRITDPITYCQSQAASFPLATTENILEDQFQELDQMLSSLLQKAVKERQAKLFGRDNFDAKKLRGEIERALGNWQYKRAPEVTRKTLACPAHYSAEILTWKLCNGIQADGVLVRLRGASKAPGILYVPDCSQKPAQLYTAEEPLWELAARGYAVLALNLISRSHSAGRTLNNRRHLHRLGWQIGQPLMGAEVAKARSALRVLGNLHGVDRGRLGIFGYDQGGQIALLAAALEGNVGATVISHYFGSSERAEWQPIDRLPFQQAHLFDDKTLAILCSPGSLHIEINPDAAWPQDADTVVESDRAEPGFTRQIDPGAARRLAKSCRLEVSNSLEECGAGSLLFFEKKLGAGAIVQPEIKRPSLSIPSTELSRFKELEKYYYRRLGEARKQLENRTASRRKIFREYLDTIGSFPERTPKFQVRWKLFQETPALMVYELTISVYKGVHTYGVLIVPKGIPAGESRPAIVCQHGFHGQPLFDAGFHKSPVAKAYNRYGAKLAERGYVVFCPYLCVPSAELRNRLTKKAHLLGGSAIGLERQKFSRVLDFLQSLPFVDNERIAFYGLSYGGYTALWFTPSEPRFAAVICSGHYNDWHRKTTDLSFKNSCYLYTPDEDMYDFGMLNKFGHAELAGLSAPRPFAVEAGHRDTVFRMPWVRAEFKRLQETYRAKGALGSVQLFEFDGPHEICGRDTFPFLDYWLNHQPHSIRKARPKTKDGR